MGGFKLDEAKIRAKGKFIQRQRQNRQYHYEQARSTRHAGRPADLLVGKPVSMVLNHPRPFATSFLPRLQVDFPHY